MPSAEPTTNPNQQVVGTFSATYRRLVRRALWTSTMAALLLFISVHAMVELFENEPVSLPIFLAESIVEIIAVVVVAFGALRVTDVAFRHVSELEADLEETRRHRAADQLEAARLDAALKTSRALSHELAQPLTLVGGQLELWAAGRGWPPTREAVGELARAAASAGEQLRRLQHLVRYREIQIAPQVPGMLDVDRSTRFESGSIPVVDSDVGKND